MTIENLLALFSGGLIGGLLESTGGGALIAIPLLVYVVGVLSS